MPRIAAALGVVVVVAACIGFNTMRYPVVWEMVAVSHQLPQTSLASEPADASPLESSSTAVKSPAKAPVARPRYICTGDVCRIARADEVSANDSPTHVPAAEVSATAPSPPSQVQDSPAAAATSLPTVKSDDPPECPLRAEPQPAIGKLVPVARPEGTRPAADLLSVSQAKAKGSSQQLASAAGVRRLPPLDCTGTPMSGDPEPLSGQQLPIYPTTTSNHSWQ